MNIIPHPDYVCHFNDEPGNYYLARQPLGSLFETIKGEIFADREEFEVALHTVAKTKEDHNKRMDENLGYPTFADYCERCRAEKIQAEAA